MFFWKIDDETIRCLINRQEIDSMGYDLDTLSVDAGQMEDFLEAIVQSSREYIDWDTDNGIQNYMARALPADQFLITISCTFQDEIIDRNLEQIQHMTDALAARVTRERLEGIASLSGDEKEKAFMDLAKDLHAVCSGNIPEEETEEQVVEDSRQAPSGGNSTADSTGSDSKPGETLPDRKLTFGSMEDLITFAGMLNSRMHYRSTLYRLEDQYELLVSFDLCEKDADAVAFVLAAEEYGAHCQPVHYDRSYMLEHGTCILRENAISMLASL